MQLISIKTHLVVFCLPVAARLSNILSAAGRVSELELDDDASMTHEIMTKIERGKQMGISPYVGLLKTLRRSLKHLPLFDDERS